MTTDEGPEPYIRAAFAAVGIPLHRLQITDYTPSISATSWLMHRPISAR